MDEPWGISGPQFLLFFGLAVAVVLLVQLSWPSIARSRRQNAPAVVEAPLQPDVYQLAYLAGGSDRTVDTAIATLLEQELLRVSSKGKLSAIGKRPTRKRLERAVHDAAKGGTATVALVRRSSVVQQEVDKIREDLGRRGLVAVGDGPDNFRTGISVAYAALLLIGIVRAVNGAQLDRPIGGLIALLVVTGILTLITFASRKSPKKPQVTDAGHAVVVRAREDAKVAQERPEEFAETSRNGGGVLFAGAAGVVALGGIALYPDDEMSTALLSGGGGGGWT
ncbi:TIGR04222 domain-containing membrane protein, partial [Amycolatopsis circi]|uniref:TIGR04222 domain-containing membrane protein n=1 Tax=Amycolatopsis circi TaxID=871959 RepID=UPI000E26993F